MKKNGIIGVWGVTFLALAVLGGCGSSGGDNSGGVTPPQSGKVVKGPVSNATVFADRTWSGVRYQKDADEVSTTTDSNGNFALPSLPANYGGYVIISQGGTDTLSGLPGIQMVAPAGVTNSTPLTTLVALDTTGTVRAKIEGLGVGYSADISQNATTAALLLAKSVETAIQVLNRSFTNENVSAQVLYELQAVFMKAIAQEIAKPGTTTATLTDPVSLETLLTAALTTALSNINSSYPNLHINNVNAVAQSVASTVNEVASGLGPISTSGAVSEASVLSSTDLANLSSAITTQVTNNDGNFSVGADVTFPTVTSTSPANGEGGVLYRTITATFSEAMDPATITASTFIVSNGATGTILYDPLTLTATFTADLLKYNTTYSVTISGAKDLAGHAVVNKTWTFTTIPSPPTVTSTFPADGAVNVSGKTITATFSHAMDPATITTGTFIVNAAGTIFYDPQTLTATFTANTLNYGSIYTVTISGAKDLAGNAVVPRTWTFTTQPITGSTGSTGGSGGTGF